MLDGLSLVSIRECSDGRQWPHSSGPIPVAPFVEADIDCFASMPTIIRLAIAKQACKFPAAHTGVHFVLLLPSWGPSENAQWTLPGIHQRMLDGRQWPHSLVLCSRYTLFGFAFC